MKKFKTFSEWLKLKEMTSTSCVANYSVPIFATPLKKKPKKDEKKHL